MVETTQPKNESINTLMFSIFFFCKDVNLCDGLQTEIPDVTTQSYSVCVLLSTNTKTNKGQ